MKKNIKNILIIFMVLGLSACKSNESLLRVYDNENSIIVDSEFNMTFSINKGESFNHPTFVIWKEDLSGNYLNTIFITKSYASGVFGYQMVGDSSWVNKSGKSIQPAALPYWTHKKGLIENEFLVPSPEHPYVDAYTGATPKSDFQVKARMHRSQRNYRIFLEVNQSWDWNKYWTNSKFPNSNAYSHSAQPSIIYSVEVNSSDDEFYLNPIGHGDPTGESGKLFTNLNTITTAKEIFSEIKAEFINQK